MNNKKQKKALAQAWVNAKALDKLKKAEINVASIIRIAINDIAASL